MFSRYLCVKERDSIVALFHELHPDPVFCSKAEWKRFLIGNTRGAEAFLSALTGRKLIIDAPEDDIADFEGVSSRLKRKLDQPIILYLMTAQGCNFDCEYCPVPETAKKHGEAFLSTKDAHAGIDLWQEHIKEVYDSSLEYFVIFYGGEPLLNKGVIRDSVAYIKKKRDAGELPKNLSIMIATNGSLVDDETIELCKEHGILVAVGLDGPKAVNDMLKKHVDGTGTYDRIVQTIRLLVSHGIRTFASVSITPYNIDEIAGYSELFSSLGVEKFGFNFLKGKLLLELVGSDGLDAYYRKAVRGVIENSRLQHAAGFEYQMQKKQVAFDTKDFFPVDCTCYGNQLVIQPDGQISNCPFFKAQLGQVTKADAGFRIWKQGIVTDWRTRLPLFHPGEAKAVCGGGCAWSSSELKGSPLAVDDSSHIFSEEALNELIWSRYDRSQSQKA